jgi:hypothetical protein
LLSHCRSAQSLALSTLQGFFFNQTLVAFAEEIRQQLGESFGGAHLRLENDAAGWNGQFKGLEGMIEAYVRAMRNATFTNKTTVYAASGLLFNGTSPGEAGRWRAGVLAACLLAARCLLSCVCHPACAAPLACQVFPEACAPAPS